MAICKDCICYESCKDWAEQYEDTEFPYGECICYKPKDRFIELPCVAQLYQAVSALADMVYQFGYSTTFRKQEAVCDGGLSALENAFSALEDCGCRLTSNGKITRKNLWEFECQMKEEAEKALERGEGK